MEYGVIFCGNSIVGKKVFLQEKRLIRIMTGSSSVTPCKYVIQRLELLTLSTQFIAIPDEVLATDIVSYKFNSPILGLIQAINNSYVNRQPPLQYTRKEHTMIA
jgi:hypothetical protein